MARNKKRKIVYNNSDSDNDVIEIVEQNLSSKTPVITNDNDIISLSSTDSEPSTGRLFNSELNRKIKQANLEHYSNFFDEGMIVSFIPCPLQFNYI